MTHCGKNFKANRTDGRYCSVACKQAAYRQRLVQSSREPSLRKWTAAKKPVNRAADGVGSGNAVLTLSAAELSPGRIVQGQFDLMLAHLGSTDLLLVQRY